MKVTRLHDKTKMAFSLKNIILAILMIGLIVVVNINKGFFAFDDVQNYHLVLTGIFVLSIIFTFAFPFLIYHDTFKSELTINEHEYLFTDKANMFDITIKKENVREIIREENKVIIHQKNSSKPFVFFIDEDVTTNYELLTK